MRLPNPFMTIQDGNLGMIWLCIVRSVSMSKQEELVQKGQEVFLKKLQAARSCS